MQIQWNIEMVCRTELLHAKNTVLSNISLIVYLLVYVCFSLLSFICVRRNTFNCNVTFVCLACVWLRLKEKQDLVITVCSVFLRIYLLPILSRSVIGKNMTRKENLRNSIRTNHAFRRRPRLPLGWWHLSSLLAKEILVGVLIIFMTWRKTFVLSHSAWHFAISHRKRAAENVCHVR